MASANNLHTINSSLPQLRSSGRNWSPQERAAIVLALSRLAISYYRPDFTEGQAKVQIQDMLHDMDSYPASDVNTAIVRWRNDPQKRFFPRGAELGELARQEVKHRREIGDGKAVYSEWGELQHSRPAMWEYQPKRFWKAEWRVSDLDNARDPDRRKNYDIWLKAVKAGKVKGKDANNY